MKLQFAWGNPRRHKKGIAKKRKKRKTGSVKSKLKKAVQMAKRKKRRHVKHHVRKHRGRKRKNPESAKAVLKGGRVAGAAYSKLSGPEERALLKAVKSAKAKYDRIPANHVEAKKAARDNFLALQKRALSEFKQRKSYLEQVKKLRAIPGARMEYYNLKKEGDKTVATRRKGKKGGKKGGRKGGKKTMTKKQKAALRKAQKAAAAVRRKKGHKPKSRKGKKSRKKKHSYPKMYTHRHSKKTRHITKGSVAKFSAKGKRNRYKFRSHFGKGKKKVSVSGSVRVSKSGLKGRMKINPYRRNPMKDVAKKALGLDTHELQLLAVGAAAAPISAALLPRIPGVNKVIAMFAQYIPAKYQTAGVNLLVGAGFNLLADQKFVPAGAKKPVSMIGEGLAAAAVIQLVSSVVSDGLKAAGMSGFGIMPQLNGINYTPMRGINYTPNMRGINYTPQMRGMGVMPQLSGPDFGRSPNYGGGGGSSEARTSPADFGACNSQDSESDWFGDEDDNQSSSMN